MLEPTEVGDRVRRPQFLPAGAGLLYSVNFLSNRGEVRRLRDGSSETIVALDSNPRDAAATEGRLYVVQEQGLGWDLWSVALDDEWRATGEPALVATNADAPSLADDGTLLYAASQAPPRRLALVERSGASRPVGEAFRGDVLADVVQISPDRERAIVVHSIDRAGAGNQMTIVDLESGGSQRMPSELSSPLAGWSPDGRELVVSGDREKRPSARVVPLGGGASRELEIGHAMFQPRYAPDGEWIVYYAVTAESGRDLFRIAADGASPPEPLLREPGQQANPDVSPDGRFLAYQSDESGRPEIYVRPYPSGERKWQVSSKGGASPVWNRSGGELVWLAGNAIWSAPVSTVDGSFEAGAPRILLQGDAIGADLESGLIYYSRMYDLAHDGRHFLVAQRAGAGRNEIVYVENPGRGDDR